MSRPGRAASEKVVRLPELLRELEGTRGAGRTIGFTNGCFDLLHAGHLHLLESASMLADVLVVGINTDASVRKLKGPERPLVPFEERAVLLGALEVVDWVVGFDRDTPAELIRAVAPDVLVKGGDWAPDRIVGRDDVEARGGKVVTVPLLEGRSTSSLEDRIRAARGAGPREES